MACHTAGAQHGQLPSLRDGQVGIGGGLMPANTWSPKQRVPLAAPPAAPSVAPLLLEALGPGASGSARRHRIRTVVRRP